jgi:hypothetical protein
MVHVAPGAVVILALLALACGSSSGGTSAGLPADCSAVVLADHTSGGCSIRLAMPIHCQEIDLTGGKTVTFEWTTDGTICTTPWYACLGGSPTNILTGSNSGCVAVYTNGANVTSTTGIITVGVTGLGSLTSTSGVYYWTITNWSGTSYPAAQPFRVKK